MLINPVGQLESSNVPSSIACSKSIFRTDVEGQIESKKLFLFCGDLVDLNLSRTVGMTDILYEKPCCSSTCSEQPPVLKRNNHGYHAEVAALQKLHSRNQKPTSRRGPQGWQRYCSDTSPLFSLVKYVSPRVLHSALPPHRQASYFPNTSFLVWRLARERQPCGW